MSEEERKTEEKNLEFLNNGGDWDGPFDDIEGNEFYVNFDENGQNLCERRYTESGRIVYGTTGQVCDFAWLGRENGFEPSAVETVKGEPRTTVINESVKNVLPTGTVPRLDNALRPFYVDVRADPAVKYYLDSDEKVEGTRAEFFQGSAWITDYKKYGIIKASDVRPKADSPEFRKSRRTDYTTEELLPAPLGYEKKLPAEYKLVELVKDVPKFCIGEILRMSQESYIIYDEQTWYMYNPSTQIYEEKSEEAILSMTSSILKRVPLAPHPFSRNFGGDMMYAIRTNATLYELDQALVKKSYNLAERISNDYNDNVIPFGNCMYNIDRDIILPYTPYRFMTRKYDALYNPSITEHPVEKIYRGIIPNDKTRQFFFEAVGYTMFHCIDRVMLLLIYGPGETGKSALVETVRKAVGSKNVSNLDLTQLSSQFEPSSLLGKVMNITSETGAGGSINPFRRTDGELLKRLAGGEPVTFSRKYKEPITQNNTAKMWFVSNTLPDFGDSTSGLYRRLFIIPCREKQDWSARIYDSMQEKDAISWLINQALDGYRRFLARGGDFDPSEEMKKEHNRYQRQEGLYDFLVTAYDVNNVESIQNALNGQYLDDVYQEYVKYTQEGGGKPLSKRKMSEKIRNEYSLSSEAVNAYREGGRRTQLVQFVKN